MLKGRTASGAAGGWLDVDVTSRCYRASAASVWDVVTWTEYWNRDTPIYVNARHKDVHYERVARDLLCHVPGPLARVVDYGCGDTLSAHRLAAACGHLFLCDSAWTVRERLAARYASCPNISVISPEQFEALEAALDVVIINSVIQYLSKGEFGRFLSTSRRKLLPGGRLVVGDVVPRDVAPWRDAVELFKFAGAHGFLFAAAAGLVRSYFSDYPRVRKEAGFQQFNQDELVHELERAGFTAMRHEPNIGHNSARMTFLAIVPDGKGAAIAPELSGARTPLR